MSPSERVAASTRGILVGVGGFRVVDCATARDYGTYETREEAESVQRGCPKAARTIWALNGQEAPSNA